MKTKLVTAIYSKLGDGFPFYGYNLKARTERFYYSLVSISRTGEDIVCYCSENEIEDIKEVLNRFSVNNVVLKQFELHNFPYHERMKEIRINNPEKFFEFPHEVMWAKYYFLKLELSQEHDYHYWIDAGLSHSGLFPIKYNSGGWDGMSSNPETYNYPGIFNPELFPKINRFVEDKLLDISSKLIGFNTQFILNYLELSPFCFNDLTIGGIVGGYKTNLEWFIETYFQLGETCLKNNYILDNEQILGGITNFYPEKFNKFSFDTWYHEDWKSNPAFHHIPLDELVHFVHFFDKAIK
jgi:hypothetical protein